MCLVPCMRKTCKGKVQSACCLMNVFPFLSLLVMCFQKTTMWKVGAFYFFSQLSFAFYFLVLTEYISNIDGKLKFFLSVGWFLDRVSLFIQDTRLSTQWDKSIGKSFNPNSNHWWISVSHMNLRILFAWSVWKNDTILLLLFEMRSLYLQFQNTVHDSFSIFSLIKISYLLELFSITSSQAYWFSFKWLRLQKRTQNKVITISKA